MFYFEFQGFDKDINNYYSVFVCRKDIYPAKQFQKEWCKFMSCASNDFFFESEVEYTDSFFTEYCLKDMNV